MKIKHLLAALLALAPSFAMADTEEDGRIWNAVFLQGNTSVKDLRWTVEVHSRLREEGEDNDSTMLRPSLSYALTPNLAVGAGYAYIESYPLGKDDVHEHRLFQQLVYSHKSEGGNAFTSRTRLEERWLNRDSDKGLRLRQLLKANLPLDAAPDFSIVLSDEVFYSMNDTDWGIESGFDQNRAFLGIGYVFNKTFKLETGYLNQYVRLPAADRENHVLSTTLFVEF